MKWMVTCKETSLLASRAMDERLPFADRLAMRMHLALCKNCARFNRQLQDMRRLLRAETGADEAVAPGLTPEARQRIETEMQKKRDA
ncbi:MAG: anti-sigma factor [Betaproteobacteria bacterium HGW-Betaproteobacteria-17]|nr:MAG: anti-sigma factor [Betaproteobacteria bacterium HGW-Betaproteobacteria-17]